jgi:hypothetical protein
VSRAGRPRVRAWLLACVAVGPGAAFGAQYTTDGEASLGGEYNSNLLLTPAPHQDVFGNSLNLSGGFAAETETFEFGGRARLQNLFYTESSLDTFNQFVTLEGTYLPGERHRFGLKAEYVHDSTLTSLSDVGEVVFSRVRRNSQSVIPSWTVQIDEKNALRLDYQFQNMDYEDKQDIGFADSQIHAGTATFLRQHTERLKLTGNLAYTHYETPGSSTSFPAAVLDEVGFPHFGTVESFSDTTTIDYASAMAGFEYRFSESFEAALSAGGQYSTTRSGSGAVFRDNLGQVITLLDEPVDEDAWGYLISASAAKRFEADEVRVDFNRTITPNIYGNLVSDDRFTFTYTHKFTPLVRGLLRFIYSDRTAEDERLIALNRTYLKAQTDLIWNWSEHWGMVASYQYSQQEFETIRTVPESHAVYLTVRYLWDQPAF